MKRKHLAFVSSLVAFSLIFSGCSSQKNGDAKAETNQEQVTDDLKDNAENKEEKLASPDFIVFDKDGNKVAFSDVKGSPVLINFWASW